MDGNGTKKTFSLGIVDFNAPVTLGFALISLAMLGLGAILGERLVRMFAAYYTSFLDIWMYPRLFTHVFIHKNLEHYANNFLMILVIGPLVEEKYGAKRLVMMMAVTAFVTGLFHVVFSHHAMLLGASGIVFMMILLASFANIREGRLPLTVLLVAVLYIGKELIAGIGPKDSISHISHIIGGICGGAFGFVFAGKKNT